MIKTLINALSKKKSEPFKHNKTISKNGFTSKEIRNFESMGITDKKIMDYEDYTLDGGTEKELVGYELHKLSKMY